MTTDVNILISSELRDTIEANLDRDPVQIALDRKVPYAALVASQVKYLQRARTKLPSWYATRCVLPPLAFEQSSSEAAAARKRWSGRLCVDLTCGLGVDSLAFSHRFERVIAVERDADLAAIARENFRRLGAANIEVVNASAERFLAEFAAALGLANGGEPAGNRFRADSAAGKMTWEVSGKVAGKAAGKMPPIKDLSACRIAMRSGVDLVYADPDRRNAAGKKMVRVEDCSPDMTSILPLIRHISPRSVVKLSPLFDVAEVFNVFGPNAEEGGDDAKRNVRVEVVSLDGECKEIVAEVAEDIAAPTVEATIIGGESVEYQYESDWRAPEQIFAPERYRWLVVPDVALQKGRLARRYLTAHGFYIDSDNGYGFAVEKPTKIMGKVLEISGIEPFDPKSLKRSLKTGGIKNIDILKRNFPLSTADLARQLGVREGGNSNSNSNSKKRSPEAENHNKNGIPKLAFTKAAGRLWQIELKS